MNQINMQNPFTESRKYLLKLYVNSRKKLATEWFTEMSKTYTKSEIEKQVLEKIGPAVDEMNRLVEVFARKTENVEFIKALALSDFYFGRDAETSISFEMKNGFIKSENITYEDFVSNIEPRTYIDCAISLQDKHLLFQIKRYPQKYHEHSNTAIIEYIKKLANTKDYRGTILALILQPTEAYRKTMFDLTALSVELVSMGEIPFQEIIVSYTEYNKKGESAVLHKLFPENIRMTIPLKQMLERFH